MNARQSSPFRLSRRRFVQGLAAAGVLAATPWPLSRAFGAGAPILTGTEFQLDIAPLAVNLTGRPRWAVSVNSQVPAPILRGARAIPSPSMSRTASMRRPRSIGMAFCYRTRWMACPVSLSPGSRRTRPSPTGSRSRKAVPTGTTAIRPFRNSKAFTARSSSSRAADIRKLSIATMSCCLSDWSDDEPHTVLSKLKFQSDYYNFHQRTLGTFTEDVSRQGLAATVADRLDWGHMRMSPTDILDVSGATYTYLMNGQPPAANWTALFRPGERVRLRFINGSAMTIFDVRIPDLPMTIVQADGIDVRAAHGRRIPHRHGRDL